MRIIHTIILIFACYFIIKFIEIRKERNRIKNDSGGW